MKSKHFCLNNQSHVKWKCVPASPGNPDRVRSLLLSSASCFGCCAKVFHGSPGQPSWCAGQSLSLVSAVDVYEVPSYARPYRNKRCLLNLKDTIFVSIEFIGQQLLRQVLEVGKGKGVIEWSRYFKP